MVDQSTYPSGQRWNQWSNLGWASSSWMRASGETHGKCQIYPNIKYLYYMSCDFISRLLLFTFGKIGFDDGAQGHAWIFIAFVWPFPKGDMIILILQREISRMGCANPGLIIPDPPMLVVNSHFPCVLYRPIPLIQQTTCMDLGSPVHLGFYSTHSSKGTWTIWTFLLYFPTTLPQTNTL